MLVDDVKIKIRSGRGGNGVSAFNSAKMGIGPTGARGGKGGEVYFEGIADLGALFKLRHQKMFKAGNGQVGGNRLNDGASGEDLTIRVPVGTVIHNLSTGQKHEILKIGEQFLAAQGGKGGKGNYHYRGPRNTSPTQFQKGLDGEEFSIRLELKLIADVGFIGLPNSGKSSLINELTNAQSKVGNYKFTTLEPHLGAYFSLVLADIPGLIEGASQGRGLGVKFLRHIERTRILFHLVSSESEDIVKDYKSIRTELGEYNKTLLEKEEYVFLTKTDLTPPAETKSKLAKLKKLSRSATAISIHDFDSIAQVKKALNKIQTAKEK